MSWPSGKAHGGRRTEDRGRRAPASPAVRPPSSVVCLLSSAVGISVLAAALLANSMMKEVSRDEQMYCTAGVLLGQGQTIYRDFSYPAQLPYHPLLLAALYRSFGTTHYLLAGRLVSVLCDILVVVFLLLIYWPLAGADRRTGLLLGLAAAVLHVFNPLVDYAAGYAWNHDVVILCVMASLWSFVTTDFQKGSCFWRRGLAGALLTFATCMRVTTVLVELLFLAAVLVGAGGSVRHRVRAALPFCAGALIVACWPLWVIAQAPRAFWLNLIQIPTLYGRWLHEIGMTFDKIGLTVAALTEPGYLALLALDISLLVIVWRERSRLDRTERQKAVLTVLLPLLFFVIAYIPPTIWHQYLAMPIPFLTIALVYPLVALRRHADESGDRRWYRLTCGLLGAGAIVAVLTYSLPLQRCLFLAVPERWTPVELHRVSVKIGAGLGEAGPVLTLGPLHALEGGRDIYPELSCGSVVYRVADRLSAPQRQVTRTVGPETLPEMVRTRSPAGILVGVEPSYFASLEEPLRRLVPPGWRRDTYDDTLQAYRRP